MASVAKTKDIFQKTVLVVNLSNFNLTKLMILFRNVTRMIGKAVGFRFHVRIGLV